MTRKQMTRKQIPRRCHASTAASFRLTFGQRNCLAVFPSLKATAPKHRESYSHRSVEKNTWVSLRLVIGQQHHILPSIQLRLNLRETVQVPDNRVLEIDQVPHVVLCKPGCTCSGIN
jgi:hypothetical protein